MGKNNKRVRTESDVGESEDTSASQSKRLNGTQNSQSVRLSNSDDEEAEDQLVVPPKHSIDFRRLQEFLEVLFIFSIYFASIRA